MANEIRTASGLNFGTFRLAHSKPGAWLKSTSAPTILLTGILGYALNLLFSLVEIRFVHWGGK